MTAGKDPQAVPFAGHVSRRTLLRLTVVAAGVASSVGALVRAPAAGAQAATPVTLPAIAARPGRAGRGRCVHRRSVGRDGCWQAQRAGAGSGIPEAHREHRPHWPNAEFDHPAQSGRSASPPTSTPHGGSSDRARPSRHPNPAQGQHRHRRPDADHRWFAGAGRCAGRPQDASSAANLREAGAILLGKTNLSEWANFRSTTRPAAGAGAVASRNIPYALDRSPCGSSSGSGVAAAASLAAAPSAPKPTARSSARRATTGWSGSNPTVGLTSRAGVVPISHPGHHRAPWPHRGRRGGRARRMAGPMRATRPRPIARATRGATTGSSSTRTA